MPDFWTSAASCKKAGKPAGFALGNAVGDGNGFASWLLWSHDAALLDEEGNVIINSKETVAALKYLKELYPTFIAGHAVLERRQQQPRLLVAGNFADRERRLAVLLAEERSGDDGDRRRYRASIPAEGRGEDLADGRADAERDGVQAQPLPQRRQGLPAVHDGEANSTNPGSTPIPATGRSRSRPMPTAAVWSGDPKVKIFKDTMKNQLLERLQGPDLDGDRRGQRRLRAGADVRLGRNRRRDTGSRRRRSRAPRQTVFPAVRHSRHCERAQRRIANPDTRCDPAAKVWIASRFAPAMTRSKTTHRCP